MSFILNLALQHVLWPVVLWVAGLSGVCFIAAIVTYRILAAMNRTRMLASWMTPWWYAWLVFALIVFPVIGTVIFATPFALERELAILIRTQPPLAVDWAVSYGSRSIRTVVGVSDDDVAMDAAWLQQQLEAADRRSARTLSFAWRRAPYFLEAPYLRAAHRVLTSVGDGASQITWRRLDEQARGILTASTELAAAGLSLHFYAAAYRYLLFWCLTLAACHLTPLAMFYVLSAPRPEMELQSPA